MKVPRPTDARIGALAEAFQQTRTMGVARLDPLAECPVRPILDAAAANVLRISEDTIMRWRHLLTKEPTLSGKRMTHEDIRAPDRSRSPTPVVCMATGGPSSVTMGRTQIWTCVLCSLRRVPCNTNKGMDVGASFLWPRK